jgi:hypothetical protein
LIGRAITAVVGTMDGMNDQFPRGRRTSHALTDHDKRLRRREPVKGGADQFRGSGDRRDSTARSA